MLSCYFTTTGFYFSSLISVIGIYVFLYGQLYLVLSGLEKTILLEAKIKNIQSLQTALEILCNLTIIGAISSPVLSSVGERYYKVTAEALRVCRELVCAVRPNVELWKLLKKLKRS
ncbi:hypothetical protein POM88_001034 [Heracleum sosnowskyi]|uniref:Uncharacterized protein n=1 Tax=Heracleum sosnowskyi TaxID=360622 RepID=A0AAD8JDA4_9APIA|nr:hypothetical protein POM88_001034 [Heracleum sosnowskyi]